MTIVATRLPPSQQPIGGALFGVTAVLGPVLGPLVGGWLTESFSWHYAFFLNLPIGALLLVLLIVGLPHQRARFADLFDADWLGIVGMILGLGCMTVVLEEGQREQWFDSPTIIWLSLAAAVGFLMLFAGQFVAKRPVIALRLLLDRQFGAVAVMAVVLGMVLYGSSFVIPQFLAVVADYNALQSGHVVLLAGVPTLVLMPFTPLLLRHVDIRLSVGVGLAIMAGSCWIDTALTVQSSGEAFTLSQLMRGVGTILCFLFLNQAAISSVDRSMAADAAGLFNAARNIGGSMVLAAISTVQDQRLTLHSRRLEETLSANASSVQDYISTLAQGLGGQEAAMLSLTGTISLQALVMTYNDIFFLLAIGIAACAPLVLLLRPLPKNLSLTPMH